MNKINIMIFVVTLLLSKISAQTTFDTFFDSDEDELIYSVIEDNDNNFVLVGNIRSPFIPPYDYDALIIKLNSEGEITDSLVEMIPVDANSFLEIIEFNELYYIFGSRNKENDTSFLTLSIYDKELVLQNYLEYCINNQEIIFIDVAIDSDNNFILTGGSNYPMTFPFFAKINPEGELIQLATFESPGLSYSITESNDKSKYFAFGSYLNDTLSFIHYMDKNLDSISIHSCPNSGVFNYSTKWLTDTSFIVCTRSTDKKLTATLITESLDQLAVSQFKSENQAEFPASNNGLSIIDTNIYIGGTTGWDYDWWPQYQSWFHLVKLYPDLSPKWEKWYGDNYYNELSNVLATNDGGCLMVGTKYNYDLAIYEKDIYIVKVDTDGLITWEKEIPVPQSTTTVYPNPGEEKLILKTIVLAANFQLTDLQGKVILQQKIQNDIAEINTQTLSSGTYLWTLTKEGRVVESGKWVKN